MNSAARWEAARESLRLRRGLPVLATTAVCVPLCGFLLMHRAILFSFKSCPCGGRLRNMARMLKEWSDGLALLALALGVGIVAHSAYRLLSGRATEMTWEMEVVAEGLRPNE